MGIAGLFGVIVLAVLAGYIFMRQCGCPLAARIALSYLAGLGIVTLQMFFYSIASISFNIYAIALPWAAAGVILLFFLKRGEAAVRPASRGNYGGLTLLEWAAAAIILFQAVFAVVNSVLLPISGFDTWVIWFIKGQAFYHDKAVTSGFFLNSVYSNGNTGSYQYPLSIPLTVTLGYLGMGRIDDQTVKLLFSLHFIALILIVYYFLRAMTSRQGALILTAMLVTVPRIMQQAGLSGVGYADLPLAGYFLAAGGFGYRYIQDRERKDFLLAIFFMCIGATVKNEGVAFLAVGGGLLTAYSLYADKRSRFKLAVMAAVFAAVIVLPWQIYLSFLPRLSETSVSEFSTGQIISGAARLPLIFKTIMPKLFTANKYHLTWPLYIVAAAVSWRRFKSTPYLFLHALILIQFASYIFVYMITPFDLVPQIDTSFDRLTIHLIPLAYLTIGAAWFDLFGGAGGKV